MIGALQQAANGDDGGADWVIRRRFLTMPIHMKIWIIKMPLPNEIFE